MGLKGNVLQIVGYQNSGKTTLIEKLIKALSEEEMKVGTIKHHGHGGEPDTNDVGKDTYRHRQAGAVSTAVEGDGSLHITTQKSEGWQLNDVLSIYEKLDLDFILVEGFKKEGYPKVVLLRNDEDLKLIDKADNIVAVITWIPLKHEKVSYPCFHINDMNYIERIIAYLKGGKLCL